jgi:1-acyl-sn-glycerol-3-phosphate acyltransferase
MSFKTNSFVLFPLTLWAWTFYVAFIGLSFPIQVIVFLLTYPFDKKRYASGRLFRQVIVAANYFNPMWNFSVHNYDKIIKQFPNPKTVVVCNHSSLSDPLILSMLPFEMKFLTKSSVFNIPIFGWLQRLAGDVGIVRTERDSIKNSMLKCKRWLDVGMPVIFFPEGTRSADDELLPFKDGAFRLALENGADILPLALAGTATAIRKGTFMMGFSKGLITAGTPISTKGMTVDDVQKLKELARAQIISLLNEIRPLSDTLVLKGDKGVGTKVHESSIDHKKEN